ncbi:hypothetical protein [Dongia sp.]|uniref:hypothetical protein n=1 Tax=Dongia sp. TaxID=1977262 RepID=UPI0035B45614
MKHERISSGGAHGGKLDQNASGPVSLEAKRSAFLLVLCPLLLLTSTGADARIAGKHDKRELKSASNAEEIWRYDCSVERQLKGGTISLSRLFKDDGSLDAGDFMRWNSSGDASQRPLGLELSYIWEPAKQPAIEPRAIELKVRLGLDTNLPEVAWFRVQRPFPVEPYGVIGSTALSTEIFPYSGNDLRNGHGELPLGDLLAYAEGYETLDWSLIRPSDQLGASKELARGIFDIATLREAAAALPNLRDALATKTEHPKVQCERVRWPSDIRY